MRADREKMEDELAEKKAQLEDAKASGVRHFILSYFVFHNRITST